MLVYFLKGCIVRLTVQRPKGMTVKEALCVIVGLICFIWGVVASITILAIVGVILLAIGGVWVLLVDVDFDYHD